MRAAFSPGRAPVPVPLLAMILFVGLSACAPSQPGGSVSGSAGRGVADLPSAPSGAADTCGASALTHLVGQPATALERVLIMREIRVIRPQDAVTEDFRPARLNVYLDPPDETLFGAPEAIRRLTCA